MNHIEQTIMELMVLRDRADELIDGLRQLQQGLKSEPSLPPADARELSYQSPYAKELERLTGIQVGNVPHPKRNRKS